MKLAQLQHALQAHVLSADTRIVPEIITDERFAAAMRLGVYTGAYAARLTEVLAETFPPCAARWARFYSRG